MCSPSASLAVWASSWLSGVSSPDDVIDALYEWAPMHLTVAGDPAVAHRFDLPWPDPKDDGVAGVLRAIRRVVPSNTVDGRVRLQLPIPGQIGDLPPRTAFSAAAVTAGQAVVVGVASGLGLGLVPRVEGPDVLCWTMYPVPVSPEGVYGATLGEAEYAMRDAVRGAAEALSSMAAVPSRSTAHDPRTLIEQAIAESSRHRFPPGSPERALRVLESADRVAAILSVAESSTPTEAPSLAAAAAREELIRPLWTAVRSARLVAVSACIGDGSRGCRS